MTKTEYTITAFTENQVGLLNRIAIIFSRRKINIDSINSSPTEIEGIHRFNIVIFESLDVVKKVVRQIEKQIDVLKVFYNTEDEIIWQEMALYKVSTSEIAKKVKVERLLRAFGARAVVIREDFTVFETTGHREETQNLLEVLEPIGIIEFVRSARIAINKASKGIHSMIKDFDSMTHDVKSEIKENKYLDKGRDIFSM
ncbi:MAG: acetolactate synthase small subunit [Saprospiraceae bacterium]|nr:acetolactate synthase small subunit [Saprospiraceae bacterium]